MFRLASKTTHRSDVEREWSKEVARQEFFRLAINLARLQRVESIVCMCTLTSFHHYSSFFGLKLDCNCPRDCLALHDRPCSHAGALAFPVPEPVPELSHEHRARCCVPAWRAAAGWAKYLAALRNPRNFKRPTGARLPTGDLSVAFEDFSYMELKRWQWVEDLRRWATDGAHHSHAYLLLTPSLWQVAHAAAPQLTSALVSTSPADAVQALFAQVDAAQAATGAVEAGGAGASPPAAVRRLECTTLSDSLVAGVNLSDAST